MIGARDMAFPRLNAFGFWMTFFGGLLLYFSFVGGEGLFGAGSAPDVGWFAYAPLTAKAFSRGHSTDYWSLAIFAAGIGTIASAVNIVTTVACMRCPGMTLRRMPLLAWMMLTMAAMTLIVMTPLSAAQIMLSIDRYLGGHFFDTQAGGSAVLWQHFFWIFGHPEVYVLVIPGFAFVSEIIPVFSRKAIFGYPAMVAAVTGIGFLSFGVWAHHMFTIGMTSHANTFFALITMAVGHSDGHQDLQLARHALGRQDPLRDADALLPRVPLPVSHRGTDGDHARVGAVRLAALGFLLRRGALPLRARRRAS